MTSRLRWASGVLLAAALMAAAGCGPAAAPAGETAPPPSVAVSPAPTAPSPVAVRIPQIGARSTLIGTGLDPDGRPEVPSVQQPMQASWATWSRRPGSPGVAVLYGHVNGEQGGRRGMPGIFARLTELQPGNVISIDQSDGSTIVYRVARVETYAKAQLDVAAAGDATAREVYGDTTAPELRLVTCGGSFDPAARSYRDQVVVFARLDAAGTS